MRFPLLFTFLYLMSIFFASGQVKNITEPDSISTTLHKNNIGKITFMPEVIPIEEYKESDFLKSFELKENADFNIRVFLGNSLINYLHQVDSALSIEQLVKNGNYQFSFFVNDSLIYCENLHPGAGTIVSKNSRTILRVPFLSSTNEDSWGRFLWMRFYFANGGEDALSVGMNRLRIEMRPYIKQNGLLRIGDLIAEGEIDLMIPDIEVSNEQINIQHIQSGSDWIISDDLYNRDIIKELNKKIVQRRFRDITSIVVIKDKKLLIEEYFNGADRNTLHDTRSVGKSFTSTIMGIAIYDNYLKDEYQTLKDFYNLTTFSNYSPRKEEVTLKSLLTMSSAFDGSDDNYDSPGNEERMYPTDNWVKFALDLPMDITKCTGKDWSYFTAGVVVLGDILNKSVPGGLEKYAHEKLFKSLRISDYKWQYTPQHVVNTAGSLQMNSLDYAKFGQLYNDDGFWKGKQLFTKEWKNKSFTNYFPEFGEEEGYGYLFWKCTYTINDKAYESFVCSGNGGNKIFVFTDEPLVVVITATAYNQPYAHSQIDKIMQRYILPAVIGR